MSWQIGLIILCAALVLFCAGVAYGQSLRKKNHYIPWHRNAHDPRDAQTYWNRIWRHR